MKATHALPTEERVQRMNDVQWLWYYFGIQNDREEEEKLWKRRFLYMAQFVNYDMMKEVLQKEIEADEAKNGKSIKHEKYKETNVTYDNQIVNSEFDEMLKEAMNGQEFSAVELPGSNGAGDANESKDNFLDRVFANETFVNNYNNDVINKKNKIYDDIKINPEDMDDVDIFVYDDEDESR